MIILIIEIILLMISIGMVIIGVRNYLDITPILGSILALLLGIALVAEFAIFLAKPLDYKKFKIEYETVKEMATSPSDIRDTNYTQKIIEINLEINKNKEFINSPWVGIFYNRRISELELIKKERN